VSGTALFGLWAVTSANLIAGMHTASEPLFVRNPLQKSRELPPFVL
jgi:hypothetical protein